MPEHNDKNVNKLINDLLFAWSADDLVIFASEKLHAKYDNDAAAFQEDWALAIEQGYLEE